MQAARRGRGGRRFAPRKRAWAGSALPGPAADGRGLPRRHERRRSAVPPEAVEREPVGARLARRPRSR
eukprot:3899936-Pleurochrysis_carterae.AAC.1